MSFAEVVREVNKPSNGIQDQSFLNAVYDLRLLFLYLEDQVQKRQRLPVNERLQILGDLDDAVRHEETFVHSAFDHTERKLTTNKSWDRAIKQYPELLQGLATYAQTIQSNLAKSVLKESEKVKELAALSEQVLGFCKKRGFRPAIIPSTPLVPANDPSGPIL